MRGIDKVVGAVDAFQRRSTPAGFLYGVVKKFGNDNGGMLAGLMTYYGFLSLFPLLLLLITIVGLVTGGSASATHRIEHSALAQFPVVGDHLGANIHALHNRAGIGLAVGIILLIWGSQGAAQTAQHAMADIWDIPLVDRPGFVARLLRSLGVVAAVGVFLLVSTALAGVVTVGNRGGLAVAGAVVVSILLNAGIYALVLPAADAAHRPLAVAAARCGSRGDRMDGAPIRGRRARRPHPAEHEPGLRLLRHRARSARLDLSRLAADRLCRRGQRRPSPPSVATFVAGAADAGRPGGAQPDGARATQSVGTARLRGLRAGAGFGPRRRR